MESLFLSHSHGDHELAGAVRQLIESCFAGHIEVKASSSAPSEAASQRGAAGLIGFTTRFGGASSPRFS
jgi:hypothetical protein